MTAPAVPTPLQANLPVRSGPYRLAVALVALTLLVIVKGAMVTSTFSGLAFADWPLSDGELMPERSYTTLPGFFEHFHRIAGALAGLLSVALTLAVFRSRTVGRGVRQAALVGLGLIVVQGVIGGVGVLAGLPHATSVAHGTLAQLTIAVFAVTAYLLSGRWQATRPVAHPSARTGRRLAVIGVAAVVLQTVIGAIARHANHDVALWTHVGNAFVVFLVLLIASSHATGRFGQVPGVTGLGKLLLWLLVVQVVLGFVALLVRTGKHPENIEHLWRASLISAHVLTGALLTLVMSLLAAHVFRGTLPPASRSGRA